MKQRLMTFAVPVLGLMLSMSASGIVNTTITSGGPGLNGAVTGDANQTNTGPTVGGIASVPGGQLTRNIAPNGAWAAAPAPGKWVSAFTNQAPGNQIANGQWVDFFHTFVIGGSGQVLTASLTVFADDKADVYINNNLIYATPGGAGNGPCNLNPIGCVVPFQGSFNNVSGPGSGVLAALTAGSNTLRVRVYQTNGGGFGTSYRADFSAVPEPGFYGVLSLGLGGLFVVVQRRRKNANQSNA